MRALIQRVLEASVTVAGEPIGRIGPGLLVLLAVQRGDDDAALEKMARKLLGYRVFADADGRMNHNVVAAGGGILLVSQFTLAADTGRGLRPSFTGAAEPALAERYCDRLAALLAPEVGEFATGRFGADMQVHLINDGPVTFLLET